jgi:AraC-like DNA-binding protein
MPDIAVMTFTDPDAYQVAIRNAQVESIITGQGDFRAELTHIGLRRLSMQRGDESLSRLLRVATDPNRAGIVFPTAVNQPAMYWSGVDLSPGEVIVTRTGSLDHVRSSGTSRWGTMSLTVEDLVAASYAITGREFIPPAIRRRITPAPLALSRLSHLHEAAGHLAKAAPEVLANPEVARAIEQALVHAMITCVADSGSELPSSADRLHRTVILRLENAFQANSQRPLYLAELCAAAHVSERTLRSCCQEHLGMSPTRYLWLRRMHLARRALLMADPTMTTVTDIATNHGFWEFGHFSVAYRSQFGESPSASLRRVPRDSRPGHTEFSLQLPDSA